MILLTHIISPSNLHLIPGCIHSINFVGFVETSLTSPLKGDSPVKGGVAFSLPPRYSFDCNLVLLVSAIAIFRIDFENSD